MIYTRISSETWLRCTVKNFHWKYDPFPRPHSLDGNSQSVMLEQSLMLISSFAVVERMVTGCWEKLKTTVVKQKSFKLERKGGKVFPADRKRRQTSFFALEWKTERQIQNSARKQHRGLGFSKQLCPALTSSIESHEEHLKPLPDPPPPPKKK